MSELIIARGDHSIDAITSRTNSATKMSKEINREMDSKNKKKH